MPAFIRLDPKGLVFALAASSTVRFDPAGRSDDYEIIVSTANGSIRVRVSGVTGWINDCQEAHE